MSQPDDSARSYNHLHTARKYTAGKRRFSVYWTWSYPWEANRDTTEMDNRFSTMTEVRRVAWPAYETAEYSQRMFLQGIAGTLELFHLSIVRFQEVVGAVTGSPVAVYQRIDQAGQRLPLDERILADTDTLMVFGLDHLVTEQEASPEEIEAVRQFLRREGTCLILGPHHDVGSSADLKERANGVRAPRRSAGSAATTLRQVHAVAHQGTRRAGRKPLGASPVPRFRARTSSFRSPRSGTWTREAGSPAFRPSTSICICRTMRSPRTIPRRSTCWLGNRSTSPGLIRSWRPETKSSICFFGCRPPETRAGDILLADSTIFTTLFGGDESLENFWTNIATR